jgi:hypothetical protein
VKLVLIVLWLLLITNVVLWLYADIPHHIIIVIGWLLCFPISPFLLPDTDPWRNVR